MTTAASNRSNDHWDGARCRAPGFFSLATPATAAALLQTATDTILAAELHDSWLSGSVEQAREALQPYSAEHMVAWPVSTRVNSPKNNDAKLLEPI